MTSHHDAAFALVPADARVAGAHVERGTAGFLVEAVARAQAA